MRRHQSTRDRSGLFPFAFHQGLEYLAAVYLGLNGAHIGGTGGALCAGFAAFIAALAVLTRGPLGFGPLPATLHRVGDLIVIAGLGTAPFVLDTGATAALLLVPLAAAMVVLVRATDYRRRKPSAAHVSKPLHQTPGGATGDQALGSAARALGVAVGKLRSDGPRAVGHMIGRYQARRRPPR